MRVFAILAHDNPDSLNASIFNKIVEYLKSKEVVVDVLELYQYADQIPFYTTDCSKFEETPFFKNNKERFMSADRLLVVFPVYWYSYPAILKAWVDMITNFAWKYSGGLRAEPLHKIKSTLTINSSHAPVWFREYISGDLSCKQAKSFYKWIGINKNGFYRLGNVRGMDSQKFDKIMGRIFHCVDSYLM